MKEAPETEISYLEFKKQVLDDYQTAVLSRSCSLLGRREVLSGKGKFGIFGDGKELPQIAINRFFKLGDYRAGYYRDQTFLMGQGLLKPENLFAALYAHLDETHEPMSSGRQMSGHFMTPNVDADLEWIDQTQQYNHTSDISPTAGQMPRLLGLAQASKVYRSLAFKNANTFSRKGNEIAWGTIGNASTSEGLFLEAINAAGVLQVPMVISVWDDDYGISVHNKDHTTKESISEALSGFQRDLNHQGLQIFQVNGWDYPALIRTYEEAAELAREKHIPVLVHVVELTQPTGHSTSGSHERYKSKDRLAWETEYDCNAQFRSWILKEHIATEEELSALEKDADKQAKAARRKAWEAFLAPIQQKQKQLTLLLEKLLPQTQNDPDIQQLRIQLRDSLELSHKTILSTARKALFLAQKYPACDMQQLKSLIAKERLFLEEKVSSKLYSASPEQCLKTSPAQFPDPEEKVDGRIIIRDNFKALLEKHDNLLIFGEDCGAIGDVNQGLEGLQEQFGALRVADTGIREATIIGQGIGMAYRGLRPIAEIQYLDYVLYALHTLSDDLASLFYRTDGKQVAPLIIRTRGHRLEGIWHSGSPMGGMLGLLRGIYILVPRNMIQAAGFYNSLLEIKQPAIVVESLNGYRLKESLPQNLGSFKTPLGKIECLRRGTDITVVSYGSTLRLVEQAAPILEKRGVSIEIIDIQSLIPFDIEHELRDHIAQTNRVLIVDEDVPGGASAYILQQLLDQQQVFELLDSPPTLLSAKAHRPAYGSDGDYCSKPQVDDIVERAYQMMHEVNPDAFPLG